MKCFRCGKEIPTGDLVYGNSGQFYCDKCFKPMDRNKLESKNVRDFYKDRARWNEKAKQQLDNILKNSVYTNYKPLRRDLD